jgi:hypothetical protein
MFAERKSSNTLNIEIRAEEVPEAGFAFGICDAIGREEVDRFVAKFLDEYTGGVFCYCTGWGKCRKCNHSRENNQDPKA